MRILFGIDIYNVAISLIIGMGLLLSGCDDQIALDPPVETDIGITAFQYVRVITIASDEVLNNQTVIVEGANISVIGSTDSTIIPNGARLIDGTGLTLMPGLTDMHAHYQEEEKGALFVVNGITTVRNMWGSTNSFRFDTRAKTNDLVGPNVYTTGPLIDGPNPIYGELSVLVDTPEAAVAAVDSQFATGYTGIKLYEMLTDELYKSAVSAAKERGMRIASHTPTAMQVEDLLELKIDSIEHLDGYGHALSRGQFDASPFSPAQLTSETWKYVDEAAIEPLAKKTAEANVWNIPTLTYFNEQYIYATDADNFFMRNEIRYVTPGVINYWQGRLERMKSRLPQLLTRSQAGAGAREKFVKALYDVGAPLLIGTDTPNPFIVPGYSYHDELNHFSNAGIPIHDILRMATSEAARYLEVEGQFGIVAVGARADLILVAGDPLQKLSVLREPVGVMVNGHWRTHEELINVLESNASKFESAPQ